MTIQINTTDFVTAKTGLYYIIQSIETERVNQTELRLHFVQYIAIVRAI